MIKAFNTYVYYIDMPKSKTNSAISANSAACPQSGNSVRVVRYAKRQVHVLTKTMAKISDNDLPDNTIRRPQSPINRTPPHRLVSEGHIQITPTEKILQHVQTANTQGKNNS